jgi:serine/threonine protein kinase
MKTAYVGTKGYQAPELLLKRKYTNKCDVFSVGVIMFILMTGYPPLEQADANDNWYRKVCQKKYSAFWNKHRGCGLEGTDNGMDKARDLIEKMLCYQPTERLKTEAIKEHPWIQMKKLGSDELFQTMKNKHASAVAKKKNDSAKQEQLQTSIVMRDIAGEEIPAVPKAGHNLPPATTFAILSEDGDEDENQLLNRLSHLLDVFAELINSKGGRSKRAARGDGPDFWTVTGQCMSADNEFMTVSSQIVQKEVKGKNRHLLSFKVGSKNLGARLNMVEYIKNQFTINWDDSVTMDDLETTADYDEDYDYAADFADLHAQVDNFLKSKQDSEDNEPLPEAASPADAEEEVEAKA